MWATHIFLIRKKIRKISGEILYYFEMPLHINYERTYGDVSHPEVNSNGRYVVARQEATVTETRQEAGFPNATISKQYYLHRG